MRTDMEIVKQTNLLAKKICEAVKGYDAEKLPHKMYQSSNKIAQDCWRAACIAQMMLTETDPEDALSEMSHEL